MEDYNFVVAYSTTPNPTISSYFFMGVKTKEEVERYFLYKENFQTLMILDVVNNILTIEKGEIKNKVWFKAYSNDYNNMVVEHTIPTQQNYPMELTIFHLN